MNKRMSLFKSLFKYTALIFILNLWCSNVSAYVVNTTSEGAEIKWSNSNVTYYINTSGGPSNNLAAIQASMQTWTDVVTSSFTFVYEGTTTSTDYGTNDGVNIAGFGPLGATGVLAQNTTWYYISSGEIIDSDIQFNTDYPWNTDGSLDAYDVQNIGTHELGHSLSLADLYDAADSEKTMYGYASLGETEKRTLDQDDIDGIAYLNPFTTWTGGGADNFASNPANWSGNVVPQDGDDVVFDGTSTKDCTWDIYVAPASLTLDSGYTGAVTLNLDLTVTGNVIISGGTLYQNNKNFKIGFGAAEVPPYTPSGLGATAISASRIDLSWTDNSDSETGFKIERKTGIDGTYSQIDTVGADVTIYSDTELTPETTYYYQVKAYNSAGDSAYSNEDSAATMAVPPPTATTDPATNVNGNSATLNATVNPNGSDTTVYFEWGTTSTPYDNTTTLQSIGSGTGDISVSVDITGLSPNTTYYYRVVATNDGGSVNGDDISFTTSIGTIQVNATLDGVDWTGSVNYTLSGPENIDGSSVPATFSGKPGTYTLTYNAGGPSNAALSSISPSDTQTLEADGTITFTLVFVASADVPPTATTDPATNVNGNSATLNATVNPNGSETTVYFEWGTDTSYGNTTSFTSIGSGTDDVSVAADITGLSLSTTYYYRVVATNDGGTTYGDDVSFTTPPITLTITYPLDGDTIYRPDVMVEGTVTNSTGNETGVTVNGIVATVMSLSNYNGEFFVNHVPLEEGSNIITASATDTSASGGGNTASTSITVNAVTTTPHVTLNANIESGIAPLETYFSVSTAIPNAVASYEIDFEGDGVIGYTGATFEDISFTYDTEGVYYPTITVTDDQSITYSDTIVIVVLNEAELDALLRAKWDAMTSSLSSGDTTTALTYIAPGTKTSYEEMFDALIGQLPSIVATETEFNLISIKDDIAEYELVTLENGTTYSYEVIFIKDKDGIWIIQDF